jgi:D-alanyl-D-alanine dipeptidase
MKGYRIPTFMVLLFGFTLALPQAGFAAGCAPPAFVDVTDVVPGVHLDMRYFTAHNFVGTKVDGYRAPRCLLTRHAAEALRGVQKDLQPFGLSLKIYDCYRPQSAVNHFMRWAKDIDDTKTKKEFYPDVDKRNLFKDGYIAEKSGHSRGSTVDLTIVISGAPDQETYRPGQPLFECYLPADKRFRDNSIDMGTGFDCFSEASHTAYGAIGAEQRIHRALLKTLMEKHGFVNYDKEWWHYTLKHEPFPDTYFDFAIE